MRARRHAPATAAVGVAAVTFRATLTGTPVRGPQTDRVLAGFRRDGADRGRGRPRPSLPTAWPPSSLRLTASRRDGRGWETVATATRRGARDKALAAVLFQGGLRRSVAAALEWRDIAPAATEDAILVTVRRSKTDQEGTAADVRYSKNGAAAAVLDLRPAEVNPTARVFGGLTPRSLGRRFTAAAKAAGIEARLTAHSGRVGLASELTARGASTAAARARRHSQIRPTTRPTQKCPQPIGRCELSSEFSCARRPNFEEVRTNGRKQGGNNLHKKREITFPGRKLNPASHLHCRGECT